MEQKNTIYNLICVSSHKGKSSEFGHYTASCFDDDNKYYNFDDTKFISKYTMVNSKSKENNEVNEDSIYCDSIFSDDFKNYILMDDKTFCIVECFIYILL